VSDDLADKTGAETAKPKRKRGPGKPFQAGAPSANPNGRPPGSRNRTTIACEALLAGEAEAIVRKAVALAKKGDVGMIRVLLGYILPPKPDRNLTFTLPPIETAQDALMVSRSIVEAVASGELSPDEGASMSKTLETHIKLFEVVDLETRLTELERERGIGTGASVQ
jgi:hypothetical protein